MIITALYRASVATIGISAVAGAVVRGDMVAAAVGALLTLFFFELEI